MVRVASMSLVGLSLLCNEDRIGGCEAICPVSDYGLSHGSRGVLSSCGQAETEPGGRVPGTAGVQILHLPGGTMSGRKYLASERRERASMCSAGMDLLAKLKRSDGFFSIHLNLIVCEAGRSHGIGR